MIKKIIFAIVILIIALGIYQGFIRKEKPSFTLAEVIRGNISQEVSEVGTVKKGEEINLSFKNAGRIEKIYVGVGDPVKRGDILARQETSQLKIQLEDAKAGLSLVQAQLNKLLAGASPEEIQIQKTAVDNAGISLEQAERNLKDVETLAAENLKAAYEDALNILDDAYLKADNAFMTADLIQRNYFTKNDQEGIRVRENRDEIEKSLSKIKSPLDVAKADPKQKNIDLALSETKTALDKILSSLRFIREICESWAYRNIVSSADKTSLDNQKNYISTALTSVTNSEQTISLTKLTNESNINTAKASLLTAEGSLKAAQDQLTLLVAPPRQEDIELYQAQVKQGQAQVQLLENQIEEAILRSPISGQITKVIKRRGETVQPMMKDVVISLIPEEPFQIEVDIPEVEIGKIDLGDPGKITLDAFPEEEFSGQVIEIEPAETIISGVVYYKIKISLDTKNTKIKPGMTANVTIITDFKENVLILPQRAVIEKNGKKFVRVPEDSTFKEIEVQTGLSGSGGEIEIISGLKEGDKVITFIKSD